MKILYCDCFSGISGDMFLAAMLDAGLPVELLKTEFGKLKLPELHGIQLKKVQKGALMATQIEFNLETVHEHDSHEEHHHHGSRNLADILALIDQSKLNDNIKKTSGAIFQKLAEAEAKVHGVIPSEVHFHEVGAADSILDIVGAAIALDYFEINQVYASAVPLGSGTVQTQHGLMPVPAPATLALLSDAKAKMAPSTVEKELVTPTGAAILATLAKFEQPEMVLSNSGIGAGTYELPWPNVLRVVIGERDEVGQTHIEIETNIDDMNPQFYASVMQHLFVQGARDVYLTPIQMKKNRPGIKISVIAGLQDEAALSDLLLRETSTLGVRVKELKRHEAVREFQSIDTPYGKVSVNIKRYEGKIIQANPEYEDCLKLAEENHLPVAEIYRVAIIAADKLMR